MTNYEKIKNMTIEELADFLEDCVSDDKENPIGCYGCIYYGTHHWEEECKDCDCFEIGLDIKKWLESESSY